MSLSLLGCGESAPPTGGSAGPVVRTLTLGGYTTPREAYGKALIPAFARMWKEQTGQEVRVQESYLGSGAQARAIIGGFEADVAALSLEADIDKLSEAGLIRHDWRAGPTRGMVTRSLVVIGVRAGNPLGIKDWDDLRRPELRVLTPNVRTSGGAMWNIAALYGAAVRGKTEAPAGDAAAAERLLGEVLKNVRVMDKGARESIVNFEKGVGDVVITYENEILVGRQAGRTYEYVIPRSTVLIENPVAVVDVYADRHGVRDLAEAFVRFLTSPAAQRAFANYGLRSVDPALAQELEKGLPPAEDLFSIGDLGGWSQVNQTLFAPGALYDRVAAGQGSRP
jgi:sulfate transport system substrate-binding protein